MTAIESRTYEVTGDWFLDWPAVLVALDSTLSVELEPPDSKLFRFHFTDGKVQHRPGRVTAGGGVIAVSPIDVVDRRMLFLLPGGPFDESGRLLELVGRLLEDSGARLLSREEVSGLGH